MNAHNHSGMTLPDLKKVPGCFILPSTEHSQIFLLPTFHSAPDCHSMSANFDPVFPFGSLTNQRNSAMCRSRHYAIVGKRRWERARERERERQVKRITNKSTSIKIYKSNNPAAQFEHWNNAVLYFNRNCVKVSCVVLRSFRELRRATQRGPDR